MQIDLIKKVGWMNFTKYTFRIKIILRKLISILAVFVWDGNLGLIKYHYVSLYRFLDLTRYKLHSKIKKWLQICHKW